MLGGQQKTNRENRERPSNTGIPRSQVKRYQRTGGPLVWGYVEGMVGDKRITTKQTPWVQNGAIEREKKKKKKGVKSEREIP